MISNEEILRKLAEIEGCFTRRKGGEEVTGYYKPGHVDTEWNPLTNWSDCGPLVEKYKPKIRHLGEWWDVRLGSAHENHPDLKRAICLAIIASEE